MDRSRAETLICCHWSSSSAMLALQVPCPRTASTTEPGPCISGIVASRRLGHPNTPIWTTPSSTNANATAYWSPRRKPFVPSIGSSTQNCFPGSAPPKSIQSQTDSCVASGMTLPAYCITCARISSPSGSRNVVEVSSATSGISGKLAITCGQ